MSTKTGYGYPRTIVTYEQINIVREELINIDAFINVKRGNKGTDFKFEGMLPPTVKHLAQMPSGCYSLPNADCLSSYQFDGKINQSRFINEKSDPCDWAIAVAKGNEYLAMTAQAWSVDEIQSVFNYVGSVVEESTKEYDNTYANAREYIEDIIKEAEDKSFEQMGVFASTRSDFIVLVSSDMETELRKVNFTCCALSDVMKEPTANIFDVQAVTRLSRKYMPAGTDVIVYDKRWLYLASMCEVGITLQLLNDENNKPNTPRFFAWEDYGFDRHKFPIADAQGDLQLTDVFVGLYA